MPVEVFEPIAFVLGHGQRSPGQWFTGSLVLPRNVQGQEAVPMVGSDQLPPVNAPGH